MGLPDKSYGINHSGNGLKGSGYGEIGYGVTVSATSDAFSH